jgi:hypothetical protein
MSTNPGTDALEWLTGAALTPDEMRTALVFLAGAAPEAMAAAVALIQHRRQAGEPMTAEAMIAESTVILAATVRARKGGTR